MAEQAVSIPKVSMAAEEATFVEWLVADGAPVQEGQAIYSLATDKVETEVEAAASGILHHGHAEQDTDYPVGTRIGTIVVAG